MWQIISSCIGFVLGIMDLKIILEKVFGPADLPQTQTLDIYKFAKIFIIGKDKNFKFAAF